MSTIKRDEQVEITAYAALLKGDHLSLFDSIDRPFLIFGKNAKEQTERFLECIQDTRKVILRRNNERLSFFYKRTIYGKYPKRCYAFKTPKDVSKSSELIRILFLSMPNLKEKSYAPKNRFEEIFNTAKDPETLDDSDMGSLLDDDDHGGSEVELFTKNNPYVEMKNTYLLSTNDSLYLVGEPVPTKISDGIADCEVFDTLPGTAKSFVLIATNTGYLKMIYMKDNTEEPCCIQSSLLGREGTWHIVKHATANQFVAVNMITGVCKFFKFEQFSRFQLINNLTIDNASILDCIFLPNKIKSHFLLFIAALRCHRLVYFCIEWDFEASASKWVHHLPYFSDEKPERSIPIGDRKCFVFFHDEIHLVCADQIMSGETNFKKFHFNALKDVLSFFDAPILLKKLQGINERQFAEFTDCTVLASKSGNIVICLTNDANEIRLYSLTRFKGLKSICAAVGQAQRVEEYNIAIVSFSRTLELTIDITDIDLLDEKSNIPSLHRIIMKHTMDSSTEEASELLVLSPPKMTSRFATKLWTVSPVALTHLQRQFPVRKLNAICTLSEFELFNHLEIVDLSKLGSTVGTKLLDERDENNERKYFIFGSDKLLTSQAYILDTTDGNPKIVELDDLFCGKNELTLAVFFPQQDAMVQVTESTVYLESHLSDSDVLPTQFSPGWKIEGVSYLLNKVIIWSISEKRVSYIDDIQSLVDGNSFKKSALIEEQMLNLSLDTEFLFIDLEGCHLLVTANKGLLGYAWKDIVSDERKTSKPKIVYPKKCRCLKWFAPELCFVTNDHEFIIFNMSINAGKTLEMCYGKKDIRIKGIDSCNGLVFSTQEITLFSIRRSNNSVDCYDLKLPYQSRVNPILDVHVDANAQIVFVLYSTGLRVFDMSYLSWNYSSYLLRATKQSNKKSIFIKKLNRLLVINFCNREWDCLKLSDGKILALNPMVLADSIANPLLDVVEIPNSSKYVSLVIIFKHTLKLVNLIPYHGKIVIKEKCKQDFHEHFLFPHVEVNENGECYILQIPKEMDGSENIKKAKICCYELRNCEELHLVTSIYLRVPSDDSIKEFRLVGRDHILIRSSLYAKAFLLNNISSSEHNARVLPINNPPNLNIFKMAPLDNETFVIVYRCQERPDHISELHFFHKDDISFTNHMLSFPADGSVNLFEESIKIANEEEENLASTDEEIDGHPSPAAELNERPSENGSENETGGESGNEYMQELEVNDIPSSQASTLSFSGNELDIEMDEVDEIDAFGVEPREVSQNIPEEQHQMNSPQSFPSAFDGEQRRVNNFQFESEDDELEESTRCTSLRRPYKKIKLDKSVMDVKYDPAARLLYVLTTGGSVLVFAGTSETAADNNERHNNSGYRISTHELNKTQANMDLRTFA